jgi:hypothetical protein
MALDTIVIHHTASPRDTTTVKSVDTFHKNKDWDTGPGIAKAARSSLGWYVQYHYFIEANGVVTKCANDTELRWHAGPSANTRSIGICLAGWFDEGHDSMPTTAQTNALKQLVRELQQRYGIQTSGIVGHRHFMNKTCPGLHLTDAWIKNLVIQDNPSINPTFGKKFSGKLLLGVEDSGSIWYITPDGKRIKIGRSPDEVQTFLNAINNKQVPVTGMNNQDLNKIAKIV